jgi:hypothetical protein
LRKSSVKNPETQYCRRLATTFLPDL